MVLSGLHAGPAGLKCASETLSFRNSATPERSKTHFNDVSSPRPSCDSGAFSKASWLSHRMARPFCVDVACCQERIWSAQDTPGYILAKAMRGKEQMRFTELPAVHVELSVFSDTNTFWMCLAFWALEFLGAST